MASRQPIQSIQELEVILSNLVRPLDYGISGVSLFGSLARGEIPNDIDLLIEHYEQTDLLLQFKVQLEEACGLPVDIVPSKSMHPIIRYRALKDLKHVA